MSAPDLDAAVYGRLTADATVSGIVGTRVYSQQAPSGASLPYVVFTSASELLSNLQGVNDINAVYRVDAWADSRGGAETLAAAVFGAFHQQSVTISGWSNFWCVAESKQNFVENVDGVQYWRRAWDIRIRASED
jgi:hypothetical protein